MLPSKGWRVGEVEKCLGGDISVVLPSLNSCTLTLLCCWSAPNSCVSDFDSFPTLFNL